MQIEYEIFKRNIAQVLLCWSGIETLGLVLLKFHAILRYIHSLGYSVSTVVFVWVGTFCILSYYATYIHL